MRYVATISLFFISWIASAQIHPDYFLQKAATNYQAQHYDIAIDYAKRALNLDSAQEMAYQLLSSSYLQQSNWSEGLEMARLGLNKFPNATGLHWLMAEAALQTRQYQLAVAHYKLTKTGFFGQKQVGTIKLKKLNLRLGECYTQLANAAMQQGNEQEGLQYFKKANQLLDTHVFSFVNLAFAYAKLQQWDKSLAMAEKGLVQFPANESLIKAKANALYHKKDLGGVEKEYEKLHKSNPNDLDVAIAYGELLMGNQQFQKAAEVYDELLKKYPKNRKIYESLISSNEARLNYEGKVKILRKMLPHFDSAKVYQRIAATYEKMEKWDLVSQYYDTLLSLQPTDTFTIKQKLANVYVQQDSLNKAIIGYEELYQQQPDNVEVLESLAAVYEKTENWEQARKYYQQLETLEKSEKVYTNLGRVSYHQGNEAQALGYYEKSLLINENPESLLGIAKLIRANDQDSALHLAESAFKMAFTTLSQYEKKLNSKLGNDNSIARLLSNKELLKTIEAHEQFATSAFHYLASFKFALVNEQVASLIDDFPKSARVYFLVGEFFYANKKSEKAYQLLTRSAQLNPNFKETQMLLGAIYEERSEYYRSILAYERALTLDVEDNAIYGHLIRVYRAYDKLDLLCEKWMVKYEASDNEEVLRPHLVEALHKAGKVEIAQKIIAEKI